MKPPLPPVPPGEEDSRQVGSKAGSDGPPMTRRKKTRRRLVDAEGRLSSLSNIREAGESFARPKAEETTVREYEYSRPSSTASEDAAAEPAAEPAVEPAAELAAKPPPPLPPRRRRSQQTKLHRTATEPPAEEVPSLEAQRDKW